ARRRRVPRQDGRGLALPDRPHGHRPGAHRRHRPLHGRAAPDPLRRRPSDGEGDRPLLSLGARRARDLAPPAPRLPPGPDAAVPDPSVRRRPGLHRDPGHPGAALAELPRQRPAARVALLLRRPARLPPSRQRGLSAVLRGPRLAADHQLPRAHRLTNLPDRTARTTMRKTITGTGGVLLLQTLKEAGGGELITNPRSGGTGVFAALPQGGETRPAVASERGVGGAKAERARRGAPA